MIVPFLLFFHANYYAPPDPADIERAILDARKRIATAYLSITAVCKSSREPGPPFDRGYRIWVDGDRIRTDLMEPQLVGEAPSRSVDCLHCEGRWQHFEFVDRFDEGTRMGARIQPVKPEQLEKPIMSNIIDPRKFGIIPTAPKGYWEYPSFDYLFARPERKYRPVVAEELNGVACFRLEYSADILQVIFQVKYWVDRAEPHVCYRIEQSSLGGHSTEVLSNRFENAALREYGIPSSFGIIAKEPGRVYTETCKIIEGTINQSLPANAFKVIGFDLPDGTPISGLQGSTFVWTNGELVPYQQWLTKQEVQNIEKRHTDDSRRKLMRYGIAAGSASLLILAFCIYRFLYLPRKRRQKVNS